MLTRIVIAVFVVLLCGVVGYLIVVEPMRVRRAMAGVVSKGFSAADPRDPAIIADIGALLPLPNYRIFIASEKTQGPFTLRSVWTSGSSRSYYAYITRWQRSAQYNVEQGARQNEQLAQTCYVERVPHPGQSVVFIGYGVETRGVVDLARYHGVAEIKDGLEPDFASVFSVVAPIGESGRVPVAVQRALVLHAEYLKSAPYASLKFSAEGWGFCQYRVADADAFRAFVAVRDDIAAAFR